MPVDERRRVRRPLFCALVLVGWLGAWPVAGAAELVEARRLLLTGKYAAAAEAYAALAEEHPVAAAIGRARSLEAVGDRQAAADLLHKALRRHTDQPDLAAEAARLALQRGDLESAARLSQQALDRAADHVLSRWVQAQLHLAHGRYDQAAEAYRRLVDHYNASAIRDADSLRWIARAAAQHARWTQSHEDFSALVNELLPAARRLEADYWPAHYEAALLWLEKFNQDEADRELRAALAINPAAAEVYAAQARLAMQNYDLDTARRALGRAADLNPQLPEVWQLQADWLLANFQDEEALRLLEDKRSLNPVDEETLGRLAGIYALLARAEPPRYQPKLQAVLDEVTRRNPRPGTLFHIAGATADERRGFDLAIDFYRRAIDAMPQLSAPRAALGMLHMRLGEEDQARRLLDEAFRMDPFHVRVSNIRKVLDVLAGYETLQTEHFVIRHDPRDRLLAQHAARWLEEIYPGLCQHFDFQPPEKSLIEIFSRASNTSGHGWFSARVVGLPSIGTVGACTGKMVAMASPTDMPEPYHWARVLKH